MPFPGYVTPHWPRPGQSTLRSRSCNVSRRGLRVDPRLSPVGYGRALRGDDLSSIVSRACGRVLLVFIIFNVEAAIPLSLERDSPLAANLWVRG